MGLRGILTGAVALIALHALVARADQRQLSGLTGVATGFVRRFLDPSVPAIAERADSGAVDNTAAKQAEDASAKVLSRLPLPTAR